MRILGFVCVIYHFDIIRYYGNQIAKKDYSVDHEKLKEYFPLETVTKGMLEIYQRLLGLKFTELENAEKWHDDVSLYQVDDKATGENIGYFFIDLHPRDGKYGHAAMWGLQPVTTFCQHATLLNILYLGKFRQRWQQTKSCGINGLQFPKINCRKTSTSSASSS